MEAHLKNLFSHALHQDAKDIAKRGDPKSVPDSLEKMHDDVQKLNRALCSKSMLDRGELWIVVKLNELSERIAALEGKKPVQATVPAPEKSIETPQKEDETVTKRRPGRPRKQELEPVGAS